MKCDRSLPQCTACKRLGIHCDGYGAKLNWDNRRTGEVRRGTGPVTMPKHMIYDTYTDLEHAIDCLDTMVMAQSETAISGPFGAFQYLANITVQYSDSHNYLSSMERIDGHDSNTPPIHSSRSDGFETGRGTDADLDLDFRDLIMFPQIAENTSEEDVLKAIFEPTVTEESPGLPLLDTNLVNKMKRGKRLNFLSNYLLVNYEENFARYMSVFITTKNVWFSQCLPRVFAALGDVSLTGSTSSARLILLHSVFATSAYCLRRNFPYTSPSFRYYEDLGRRLERYSVRCLVNCTRDAHFGKYKDFLVSLLSMIMAESQTENPSERDKILGTMRRVVNLRLRSRPKQSSKALLLHRYCAVVVLTQKAALNSPVATIYDGTLDNDSWIDKVFEGVLQPRSDILQKRLEYLQQLNSRHVSLNYMETQSEFDEYFQESLGDEASIKEIYEAQSWEDTFGLPGSLAYLFKEVVMLCTALIQDRHFDQKGDHILSPYVANRATKIEIALANWQNNYEPPQIPVPLSESTDEGKRSRYLAIFSHHTQAFYEALLLYYYRIVKGVSHYLLQNIIERLIINLEAIMHLNPVTDQVVFPFLFPGFIGACEAAESNLSLCDRFDKWQHYIEALGPSFCQSAFPQVFARVRRERRLGSSSGDWWTLANKMNVKLSLF